MKSFILSSILFLFILNFISAQPPVKTDIKAKVSFASSDELAKVLMFEDIKYFKINFSGKDLKGKKFLISMKEFSGSKVKTDSVIFDSGNMPYEHLQKIENSTLDMTVIGKKKSSDRLKLSMNFGAFSISENYEILDRDDYSLRALIEEIKPEINLGEKFYLMGYILPYKKGNMSMYCEVASSGKDVNSWGKAFDIPHYVIFEMKFY